MHFIFLFFVLQPTRKLKSLSLAVLWQTSSFILMKKKSWNPPIHLHEVERKSKDGRKSSEAYKYYSKKIRESVPWNRRHEYFIVEQYFNHISLNVMLENSPFYS